MELLKPFHPHLSLSGSVPLSGFSSPERFHLELDRDAGSHEALGGGDKVYVAVGRSVEKAVSLIQWSSERFCGRDICLVHVHQPSPLIPTLCKSHPLCFYSNNYIYIYIYRESIKFLLGKTLLGASGSFFFINR